VHQSSEREISNNLQRILNSILTGHMEESGEMKAAWLDQIDERCGEV